MMRNRVGFENRHGLITADTSVLEAEIDAMVYDLYELTAEEIELIEKG
jgi:hypothetical protein